MNGVSSIISKSLSFKGFVAIHVTSAGFSEVHRMVETEITSIVTTTIGTIVVLIER